MAFHCIRGVESRHLLRAGTALGLPGWVICEGNFPAGVGDKTPIRTQSPQDERVGIPGHKQPDKEALLWISKMGTSPTVLAPRSPYLSRFSSWVGIPGRN